MPLLRAIIDTNVVFEGLTQQGGAPGMIIDVWAAGLFRACVSNALSYEYEDVLSRKLSDIRWRRIKPALGALLDKSEFVTVLSFNFGFFWHRLCIYNLKFFNHQCF